MCAFAPGVFKSRFKNRVKKAVATGPHWVLLVALRTPFGRHGNRVLGRRAGFRKQGQRTCCKRPWPTSRGDLRSSCSGGQQVGTWDKNKGETGTACFVQMNVPGDTSLLLPPREIRKSVKGAVVSQRPTSTRAPWEIRFRGCQPGELNEGPPAEGRPRGYLCLEGQGFGAWQTAR